MAESEPPRFQFGEIVRIVRATGRERDITFDEVVDVGPLLGKEFVVNGAIPTPDHQGWTICIWVPSLEEMLHCPDEALAPTGLIEVTEDDGSTEWVRLEPETSRPWRDDVLLDLQTHTRDDREAEAIARRIARHLESLSEVSAVDWRLDRWKHDPAGISMWAWSDGDAPQAFAQTSTWPQAAGKTTTVTSSSPQNGFPLKTPLHSSAKS